MENCNFFSIALIVSLHVGQISWFDQWVLSLVTETQLMVYTFQAKEDTDCKREANVHPQTQTNKQVY